MSKPVPASVEFLQAAGAFTLVARTAPDSIPKMIVVSREEMMARKAEEGGDGDDDPASSSTED